MLNLLQSCLNLFDKQKNRPPQRKGGFHIFEYLLTFLILLGVNRITSQ